MSDKALSHDRAAVCRGAGAILDALATIGAPVDGDHSLAKHIVDAELDVRALVKYALVALADDNNILPVDL